MPALVGAVRRALAAGHCAVIGLQSTGEARLDEALDRLKVFAIGSSWGGTRSLIAPMSVKTQRTVPHPRNERTILRIYVGLEDETDLWGDLEALFSILLKPEEAAA